MEKEKNKQTKVQQKMKNKMKKIMKNNIQVVEEKQQTLYLHS